MALSVYALCTLQSVKDLLGITVNTYDALLEMIIDAASDSIETYCERLFASRTYTNELYDGNGADDFWPDQFPITVLTELPFISARRYPSRVQRD